MYELTHIFIMMALVFMIGATKLRWHTMLQNVADGTTTAQNGARFRNETSVDISVMVIEADLILSTAAINESAVWQLSTQNTLAQVDEETEFRKQISIAGNGGAADDTNTKQKDYRYLRGQVVLEPGEALFSSVSKTSGGTFAAEVQIGFELME